MSNMSKIWKALGIAALAAAIPLRVKKDEETGKKKYQSLLLSVDVGPGENGEGTDIGINVGEGLLNGPLSKALTAKKESELFADDDPDAAVVEEPAAPAQESEPTPAEEPQQEPATEEDFDPDL